MLQGERVRLRRVEREDLDRLVIWRNSPDVWRQFFNKFPLSRAGQGPWFDGLLQDSTRLLLMICTAEGEEPIGMIGLDHIDFATQSCEFGNMLIADQDKVGAGLGFEAATLLLDYSFMRLNMHRVYLHVLQENQRAVNLYERCGFKVEGRLREAAFVDGAFQDVLMMSVLRADRTPPANPLPGPD